MTLQIAEVLIITIFVIILINILIIIIAYFGILGGSQKSLTNAGMQSLRVTGATLEH